MSLRDSAASVIAAGVWTLQGGLCRQGSIPYFARSLFTVKPTGEHRARGGGPPMGW